MLCLGSEELDINLVVSETHQRLLCREVMGLEFHIEINPECVRYTDKEKKEERD